MKIKKGDYIKLRLENCEYCRIEPRHRHMIFKVAKVSTSIYDGQRPWILYFRDGYDEGYNIRIRSDECYKYNGKVTQAMKKIIGGGEDEVFYNYEEERARRNTNPDAEHQ